MKASSQHKTLIVACGALAKEVVHLLGQLDETAELKCLPAGYHNHPEKIVPSLKTILDDCAGNFDNVLIGYGDCGTGGGLDRLLEDYPNAARLPGAHCYAFYAGLNNFDGMMEEELGTFFLTDYLVRHFDTLIIKGMGIDRYPDLKDTYFEHYKKLTYLAQTEDETLQVQAKAASRKLGLSYEYRFVGYGGLEAAIESFDRQGLRKESLSHV